MMFEYNAYLIEDHSRLDKVGIPYKRLVNSRVVDSQDRSIRDLIFISSNETSKLEKFCEEQHIVLYKVE